MKVRVLVQRASSARDSRFCSSSSSSRCHTAKKLVNRAQNFLNILEHLIVPETKHPVALRIEKRSADFIFAGSLDMLCAVKLDDDLAFGRAKVGEVTPNRELSSKLGAPHLASSQIAPEQSFSVGLFLTQPPCVLLG